MSRQPLETRSFTPSALSVTGRHADSARIEGGARGGDEAGARPLSPWLHPLRIGRLMLPRLRRWAPMLVGGGMLAGFLLGTVVFSTTWVLAAGLQLQQADTNFNAERDLQSYRPPDLNTREVQTLCDQQFIFERLMVLADPGEKMWDFRRRFRIEFARDTGIFRVTFNGARNAQVASEVLDMYFQIVVGSARDILVSRIQKDLDYYKREVESEEQSLQVMSDQGDEFRKRYNVVFLDQEVDDKQQRVRTLEDQVQIARTRLGDADFRIAQLPALLAELPAEIPATSWADGAADAGVNAKRAEVRQLETLYTDRHPLLRAAREELAKAEEQYAAEREQRRDAQRVPNPFVVRLNEELKLHQLGRPQLAKDVEELTGRLQESRAQLDRLPALSAEWSTLQKKSERQEGLIKRLRARLSEIEIARNLSVNRLRVLDPPNASNAEPSRWWTRAFALAGVGFAGGLGLVLGLAAVAAVRDRRVRTLTDLDLVLRAERVTRVPAGERLVSVSHPRWVQDLCSQVTRRYRRFLVVPSGDILFDHAFTDAIARQLGRAGLKTLVVAGQPITGAEGFLASDPGLTSGVTHMMRRQASPEQCLVPVAPNVSRLGWGDTQDLFDRLPSGSVEQALGDHLDDLSTCEALLILPPAPDPTLVQRLATLVDGLLVLVDPDQEVGADLMDIVNGTGKPVAMGVLTR